MLNKSNIPSRHSLFQAFGQWIVLRSQRTGKNKKEERERGREERLTPLPYPTPSLFFFFSAHISLHHPHDSNIAFPPPPPAGGLSYLAKTWVCQLVPNEQDMVYSVYMVLESFFTI